SLDCWRKPEYSDETHQAQGEHAHSMHTNPKAGIKPGPWRCKLKVLPWNYYNQGAQRKEELLDSCAVLGIPTHRVTIIDNNELKDDPMTEWNIALTAPLILKHITTHSINL
ncbi:N-acetylglucosaminyl-phosphatidylinositol de-N-acetylase, partial [Clarias magur]